MDNVEPKKNKFDLSGYGKAVSFLLLEILAVVSFSLGGSFYFYAILMILALSLIILVTFRQIKMEGVASIGLFLIPLVLFGLLSILSYIKYDPYFVLGNSPFLFVVPIALVCFAASGYFINLTGSFKIHHALIVIYSAIALLTLINLIVTMIQFVPFYPLRYSNYYFYYDGYPSPSPIGSMAYFLTGFSISEVSLPYFTFYPMILLTAFLPLGHVRFKENKRLFVLYLVFGVLGLLSIILTINKLSLLMLFGVVVLIGIITIYDKFKMPKKPLVIGSIVLGALFVIGVLVLFLNAQESVGFNMRIDALRKLTTGNSFLNRLFNANRFSSAYDSILDGLFAATVVDGKQIVLKLFGFPINGEYVDLFGMTAWPVTDSNSILFDSFFISGFLGTIALVALLVLGVRKVIQYYRVSDDDKKDKVLVLGFVIISLAYAIVNFDSTPLVFSKTITPFYLNNIFLIDLFLFGYCYFKAKPASKKEVKVNENQI